MTSVDTNILLYAVDPDSPWHARSREYLLGVDSTDDEFVLCELILIELYMTLRNPAIFAKPYSAREAAGYCQALRHHPRWRVVDYDPLVAKQLWEWAAASNSKLRHIIDARIALTLRHHGVTHFATTNTKDFQGFGFTKVFNPLH